MVDFGIREGEDFMIRVTGMDKKRFMLNADHIEKIEEMPETIITLTNGKKYIVLESIEDVRNSVLEYKHKIFTYDI
ncbi:flagellar protein FlbD [Clostridium saccharobutylicum]|uniref:Flagellar protein FlbD n=1 Tax=Clostridium saccharobutylicum TaxID=169679 RepID=A0A1S8NIC5_CLOSA|nr:flagellar protein FlbD [Clostridium saccharobutylicum]